MKHLTAALILCGGIALLASACATKEYVRTQVGTSETKLTQRVDGQEVRLKETSDRTAANAQAIDSSQKQIQGLEGKVGEVGTVAADAKKQAQSASEAVRDTDSKLEALSTRVANRNKFAMVETKTVYFDFNKADLKDEGINELEDVAKALKADVNAVVELQGFADARGTDRYNYQLTRERVDAVARYLVMRGGIDVRRIHSVGMGKVVLAAGERANNDTYAKARRVDIRLLSPQS
ncbi:MAG TPA: OmpA family protein [Methylomirabilota bacterium]|nr:OmpA family protein [Methylomirabilota bacterium]